MLAMQRSKRRLLRCIACKNAELLLTVPPSSSVLLLR